MGFKVNSYSIFNDYWGVMPLLLRVHFAIFPPKEWKMYIYHDSSLDNNPYKKVLSALHNKEYIKTIFVNEPVLKCRSMLWRMIPVWDPEVDYVFCKDADSIPTPRERKIMEEFISSDYSVLGINDNPAHCLVLMGGMIGFNTKKFIRTSNINTFGDFMRLGNYNDINWGNHGSDQSYMNSNLLPKIRNNMILYRVFNGSTYINNVSCNLQIPRIQLNGINETIINIGDKCTNYIGACGVVGPLDLDLYKKLSEFGCNTMLEFFDKHGNQEINKILREEEALI